MDCKEILQQLRIERDKLSLAISKLEELDGSKEVEIRRKISEAQKRRWAVYRKNQRKAA